MMTWDDAATIAWVALGGGVGAAVRYAVDVAVSARWRRRFPLAIFLVNVSGALALGLFLGVTGTGTAPDLPLWTVLMTSGLVGGYTTFSTASYDTVRLARSGERITALVYAVGTMVASVGAVFVGFAVGGL